MDEAQIERVRRFNRTVTERVGVLHDHYLGGDRPVGEARRAACSSSPGSGASPSAARA